MKYPIWSLFLCSRVVFANPVGEVVAGGDVAFTRPNGNELHVCQKSDRAVVEWEKFSIDAGELTKFLQPGPDSVLLNKVIGPEMSAIYGRLEANGQIILMNPHGVLVGKTGVIDACAFMAISHDLNNVEFMDGKLDYSMSDLSGVINVDGRIDASRIEIIGDRIFLTGELSAPGGEIEVRGNEIVLAEESVLDVSASENGHGGRAIVVGERSADFAGSIYAKGGEFSGDGGFIEVSSHGQLGLTGKVSTMAPNGKVGMFLIDPTNVFISNSPNADYSGGPVFTFTGPAVNIQDTTLCSFLNSSSVTVDTSNPTDQNQPGDIEIDASASFATWTMMPGNSLILKANRNIRSKPNIGAVGAGVPGLFLAQAGGNITMIGALYTNGFDISLRAGPLSGISSINPSGSVFLNNVLDTTQGGGVGGAITVQGFDITSTTVLPHQTNSGNILFQAAENILSTGPDVFLQVDTGMIQAYADRDILITGGGALLGTGVFSGLQIDVQADYNHDGVGDFFFQNPAAANSGVNTLNGGNIFVGGVNVSVLGGDPGAGGQAVLSAANANLEVQATRDFTLRGGSGGADTSVLITGLSGSVLAGQDIIISGGTGSNATSSVNFGGPGANITLLAGRDIQILGGQTPGGLGNAFTQVASNEMILIAGRDLNLISGPSAGDGVGVLALSEKATLKAGRNLELLNGASGGTVAIISFGAGCNAQAGGDILWPISFNSAALAEEVYIAADATMLPLYSAQSGVYLAGTALAQTVNVVSDGKGAFIVDTSPVGGGIDLSTMGTGAVTLYSASKSYSGQTANILFDNTSVTNAVSISSAGGGDISIAGFYNTDVNNTISTTGAILVATDHTMNINTPSGLITAGGPITLVVDNGTVLAGSGFFNNFNSGVSTTDPDQRIAIYAASGPTAPAGFSFPNQVVLGNLSSVETWDINKPLGLLSKYDTSYSAGGPVHGAGFGTSYVAGNGVFSSPVIWYKIFQTLTGVVDLSLDALQQIRWLIPERLWLQEFSILIDQIAFRDQIEVLRNRRMREGTIQSRFALASSKDYFLESTMSGENIRIMDLYQEFEQSPFWRTPDMMERLYWLEDRN